MIRGAARYPADLVHPDPDPAGSKMLKITGSGWDPDLASKGGSETLILCFKSKTGILSMKLCYKVSVL